MASDFEGPNGLAFSPDETSFTWLNQAPRG